MGQMRKKHDFFIIDNFLPTDFFNNFQSHLMSANIEWFFNDYVNVSKEEHLFQFCHRVFDDFHPRSSLHENFVMPMLELLNAKAIIRAKLNLQTRHDEIVNTGFHTDYPGDNIHRTCLLYINDNNGFTRFKDHDLEVNSVANRLVDFPSNWMHTSTTHTDAKTRVVLNVNYVPVNEQDELKGWGKEK